MVVLGGRAASYERGTPVVMEVPFVMTFSIYFFFSLRCPALDLCLFGQLSRTRNRESVPLVTPQVAGGVIKLGFRTV